MQVLIYTRSSPPCTYCVRAKKLLASKDIGYTETDIGPDMSLEDFKATFPEVRTLPLIIIDGVKIGGYDQLVQHLAA